jgi:2-iminobutanoate/2-iminopropanoate deaminase
MKLLSCLCLLLVTALHAADPAPALKTDKFKLGDWEDDIGYRQAVRVGNTLYISGSVGAGAMPDAIRGAYGELEKTLAHYGLTFAHVVKENIYTTDLDALKANLEVRRAFYGKEFPAATWVQVSRLYEPAHVLEVELIAIFPEGSAKDSKPAS